MLYSPTIVDGTISVLPVMAAGASLFPQIVVASPGRIPVYTSATASRRAPNPYHPEEVRRAIQSIHDAVVSQSGGASAVDAALTVLQSAVGEVVDDVDLLDGRATVLEADVVSLDSSVVLLSGRASTLELKNQGDIGAYHSMSPGGSAKTGNMTILQNVTAITNDTYFNAYPAIAKLLNGDLLCVFTRGTETNTARDVYFSISSDLGRTWSADAVLVSRPTGMILGTGGLTVLKSGKISLTYH